MAPKKKGAVGDDGKRVLLGRASNSVSIGIVGIPNVGKSSFFNALTKVSVPAENYPFCTIDPNEAKVAVPDKVRACPALSQLLSLRESGSSDQRAPWASHV